MNACRAHQGLQHGLRDLLFVHMHNAFLYAKMVKECDVTTAQMKIK